MTSQADLDRTLDSWFEEGPTIVATRVVDDAMATVATTTQRPARGRLPWRIGGSRTFALAGLAAAATIIVVVAASLLGRPSPLLVGGPSPTPTPTPSLGASSSPEPSNAGPSAANGLIAFLHCDMVGGHTTIGGPVCTPRLWLVGVDGSDPHPLLGTKDGQSKLSWSPDGAQIAFVSHGPGIGEARLYMTDVSGSSSTLIDTDCSGLDGQCTADMDAAFSADGRSLVFVRYDQGTAIATMDLATGRVVVLDSTSLSFDLADRFGGGVAEHPRWSPDGTKIAFSRYSKTADHSAVYVMDADGANLRRLNPPDVAGRDPAWSPDGSTIAFTSWVERLVGDQDHFHQDLYTIGVDGTGLRRLTADPSATRPVLSTSPAWLPDGRIRFIAIQMDEGNMAAAGGTTVWTIAADGTGLEQVTVPSILDSSDEIVWQPTP